MKNHIIHSGLGEPRVLLSEGADGFDPDSLVEDKPISTPVGSLPLSIFHFTTSDSVFQMLGYLQGLTVQSKKLTVNLIGLLSVGLELSRLKTTVTSILLKSFETRTADENVIFIENSDDWKLDLVELTAPQPNNQVHIKVVLSQGSI
jgi:hypothetical protein